MNIVRARDFEMSFTRLLERIKRKPWKFRLAVKLFWFEFKDEFQDAVTCGKIPFFKSWARNRYKTTRPNSVDLNWSQQLIRENGRARIIKT